MNFTNVKAIEITCSVGEAVIRGNIIVKLTKCGVTTEYSKQNLKRIKNKSTSHKNCVMVLVLVYNFYNSVGHENSFV